MPFESMAIRKRTFDCAGCGSERVSGWGMDLCVQVPLKKYLNIWTENRDNTRIIQGYFRDISEVRHLLEVSVHRLTGVILVRIS